MHQALSLAHAPQADLLSGLICPVCLTRHFCLVPLPRALQDYLSTNEPGAAELAAIAKSLLSWWH